MLKNLYQATQLNEICRIIYHMDNLETEKFRPSHKLKRSAYNSSGLHSKITDISTSPMLFILTRQSFSCKNIWQKVELTRGAGHFSKRAYFTLWRAINHHRCGHLPKNLYQVPQLDVIFRMMYHMDDLKT